MVRHVRFSSVLALESLMRHMCMPHRRVVVVMLMRRAEVLKSPRHLVVVVCDVIMLMAVNQTLMIMDRRNVRIICDRGALYPSAYISKEEWSKLLRETKNEIFDLCDNRF